MKDILQKAKKKAEEAGFVLTSWAINNKIAVYLFTVLISMYGVYQFVTLPKEQFPDIVVPTIFVQTVYVGNAPKDIENLVTRPIEKQIKGITGAKIKSIKSTSGQDFSAIIVEFQTNTTTDIAKQKVKDAVDKAKKDLPTDLTVEPAVAEFNFSEFPIMFVNVSGNFDGLALKKYADKLKDDIEELPEITRADLVGAPEREIQINVDNLRMQGAKVSFNDIEAAVARENRDISGGLVDVGNMKRSLRIKGQFVNALDLQNIIIKNVNGAPVYLKDIAEIVDGLKETESYSRLNQQNTITLNIIKRSGENLINASANIKALIKKSKEDQVYPPSLNIVTSGDLSIKTETSFNELVNSIVIGFVLVLLVLMFFMGVTNAFFVALSVPLSMFVAFLFLPLASPIIGSEITLNFIVLFALLFGLGIIVDDAIVVIENTHRIFHNGGIKIEDATRRASKEVWIPVLAGTVTTLAPFIPLLFWPGLIGKFMIYLPVMLIFTLTASLIVAFVINPVFAVDFMNNAHKVEPKSAIFKKPILYITLIFGILLTTFGFPFFGNLLIFLAIIMVVNKFVFEPLIKGFQNSFLPALMRAYEKSLRWALHGWRPMYLLLATLVLLVGSFMFFGARNVPVGFFPQGDPNQAIVYLKLPVGTNVDFTNQKTKEIEAKVFEILGTNNPLVESVVSNVAVGATDPNSGDRNTQPNLGKVQVNFVEFEQRHGKSTKPYLQQFRESIKGIPGAEISVQQDAGGPPTAPPVNIEISSEDFTALTTTANSLKYYLDSLQVPGIEELKLDVDLTNPEITINVDRERALIEGVSTGQIGLEIRTAVFGKEISKLKDNEDEYKIQLRYNDFTRKNLTQLMNMKLTFRDFSTGIVKQVPLSAVTKIDFTNTYGGIKRKNLKRVITIFSNLSEGGNAQAINKQLENIIKDFNGKPDNVTIAQTGEQEEQQETGTFLGWALVIAMFLIIVVLVLQFNSISKTFIILSEIVFSVIGVILGFAFTKMELSIVMTGIGIVGLAGIVVKNGILVVEFADELRSRGMKTKEAVIQAGKTRIIPVLLTAVAAILGLLPLATGFNINFISLFANLDGKIFFGGDSAVFWKPLAWTIIYGLTSAFFMTLLIVPAMYLMAERLKRPMRNMYGGRWVSFLSLPPLTPIFIVLAIVTLAVHSVRAYGRRKRFPRQSKTFSGQWL
jgi:multidrug efflux pump